MLHFACASFSLISSTAHAQSLSRPHGFLVGAHLTGVSLHDTKYAFPQLAQGDQIRTYRGYDFGAGIGIMTGYGFRNGLSVILHGTRASMQNADAEADNYILAQQDLGARYTFPKANSRWRPYVQGALTRLSVHWRNVAFQDVGRGDVRFHGGAFSLGLGMNCFLTPTWSVETQLDGGRATFADVVFNGRMLTLDDDKPVDLAVFRLQIGFAYYLTRSRD